MAQRARLSIWVGSTRGASQVRYNSVGRYVSLDVNTVSNALLSQPLQPTSSPQAFWESVIGQVLADIQAGNG